MEGVEADEKVHHVEDGILGLLRRASLLEHATGALEIPVEFVARVAGVQQGGCVAPEGQQRPLVGLRGREVRGARVERTAAEYSWKLIRREGSMNPCSSGSVCQCLG